jgi:4'-phosphopantetheinyl transferase EntD
MVSGSAVHDNSAMAWHELPPLTTNVAAQLPALPGLALVAGRIGDYVDALAPEERPALGRAVPKRIAEFSTGRHLARCAMTELGVPTCAIPRAEDRRPLWPDNLVGSISHAGDVAVAAVAPAEALIGVGVDLEEQERVTAKLFAKLFTAAELAGFGAADARLPGLVFSAKEAVYKAVNPHLGKFIGFQEVEVIVDWAGQTFRTLYVGGHAPNTIMERGMGHFCFFERYVLTVFMIPR